MSDRGTGPVREERGPEPAPAAPRQWQTDMLSDLFRYPLDAGYADAAAARRKHGPLPAGTRRVRRIVTVVACLIIGVLFSVAYLQVVERAPGRATARAGLIRDIQQRQEHTDALARRAEALQAEVFELREEALADSSLGQLREVEAAAGMRKVTGDGVVVTMADGPNAAGERLAQVLDVDLQLVTNALWASGAEAISVNGQRLTAATPIRAAGSAIVVGNAHVISPYEVAAIGPPDMADRFNETETASVYRAYADDKQYEMRFDVDERDDLELPAAVMPRLRYATVPQPSPSGSPSPSTSPSGGGK
ncbi:UPF0749 protein [Catellatospora sp. IY07-71]|uniref:DUF881 domain-containing protein n=1 Tax=Catellatospora sp. IY07-71 TaxID=2728827 RepID=UPI001BB42266|nr:DUF881 domain-containing protein [Catellatospora sp. IY07-71]BCJ77182.1 UPF0749 protein [Catellatospora sp. IY07-71]